MRRGRAEPTAEVVALGVVDAQLAKPLTGLVILDAFRDDAEVEVDGEREDRFDDALARSVVQDFGHELPVDL